jgi:hypothetical protein
LAADWTGSRERSLERRRMKLCIAPALERTAIRGSITIVSIELPANSSDSLVLSWGKGENPAACATKGGMVVIQNSLVTVLVTYVSETSEVAAVHVSKDMFILTLAVTFVDRNWAIEAKNSGEINKIGRSRQDGFTKDIHWQLQRNLQSHQKNGVKLIRDGTQVLLERRGSPFCFLVQIPTFLFINVM